MLSKAMKQESVAINDLRGPALRWMVAVALGYVFERANDKGRIRVLENGVLIGSFMADGSPLPPYLHAWQPDIDISQGGALIEQFSVNVDFIPRSHDLTCCVATCGGHSTSHHRLLVAVCRAVVLQVFDAYSKVSVPSFLRNGHH